MILLGGDYVTNDPSSVVPVFTSLSKLKASLGGYGVLGNNDPKNVSIHAMKNASITYLGNNGVWMGNNSSRIRVGSGRYRHGYTKSTPYTLKSN